MGVIKPTQHSYPAFRYWKLQYQQTEHFYSDGKTTRAIFLGLICYGLVSLVGSERPLENQLWKGYLSILLLNEMIGILDDSEENSETKISAANPANRRRGEMKEGYLITF